ncbi:MAG: flagellar biosynthetic protein FliO [Tepidisphaeraceae bacterium]
MKSAKNFPLVMRSWGVLLGPFFLLTVLAAVPAISQPVGAASKPAFDVRSISAEDSLESQPIALDSSGAGAKSAPPSESPAAFGATRVILALAGVVGLIFLLRGGARRLFPGAAPVRANSAVKVLARCPISPKQHLLVIQFGKRLVLVGDTGSHLNPLCEISDPEEAAGVLAQARDESMSAARRFDSFFGLARKGFAETPTAPEERFDDSHEIIADDPTLETTRRELAGLSDKVRDVARQLGSA